MKYKVGDKVRIKSLDWYKIQCMDYNYVIIDFMNRCWCGYEMTIVETDEDFYYMKEDDGLSYWTDEMIECKVEDEMSLDKAGQITDFEYEGLAYTLPDGYQFVDENGNVINATKIVLEKKEYPKTLEECCEVLDTGGYQIDYFVKPGEVYEYEKALITKISALYNLFICRDAYWKIAGEEMGLGKSWEPDWKNSEERRYCIVNIEGDINLPEKILTKWILKVTNKILVFPTAEMRDAFYENFKELINSCKELL